MYICFINITIMVNINNNIDLLNFILPYVL